MSTAAVQSVKSSFGEDLRRFPLSSTSFSDLQQNLRSLYSLGTSRLVVKYQDDEGDWINVSSDRELEMALHLAKESALRVTVTLDTTEKAGETTAPLPIPSGEPLYPVLAPSGPLCPPSAPSEPEWRGKYEKKWEKKADKFERKQEKHLDKFQRKTEDLHKKALKHGAARFVSDTFPDGTVLGPNQEFLKTWTIRNETLEAWPHSYQFSFVKGHNMGTVQSVNLPKDIAPGEEFQISIPMRAPAANGKHVAVWKFIGAFGRPFGQPFRVKIFVGDGKTDTEPRFEIVDLEGKLRDLAAIGFQDRFLNEKLIRKCRGDMDKVVWKLSKKVNKERKWAQKMERKKEKLEKKRDKLERKGSHRE